MYVYLLNRVENIVIKVDFAHCEKAMFTSDTIFSKSFAAKTPESVYMLGNG